MKAITSSFVVSESTLVAVPATPEISSLPPGVIGGRVFPGPDAGWARGRRTTVARIPRMHPRIMRMASLFVSREYHLILLFSTNRFIGCAFIFHTM
jgi:hypothetical protein